MKNTRYGIKIYDERSPVIEVKDDDPEELFRKTKKVFKEKFG